MKKATLVIGVIGADCHAVGNKVLDRVFSNHGFRVINLGVMVSQDEYIDAAIETGADAIVVSSIYGHGDIDCLGMRERCIERGLGNILLYVGGNLVVGKHDFADVETKFISFAVPAGATYQITSYPAQNYSCGSGVFSVFGYQT
ncbi:methylaspartate mutase subunit S [Escherichia coli]|uniref:methylaspartate mutase subunit S n=1 Tax=Escherichia coli TaxID=562 RepID=UPI00358DA1B1